MRSLPPFLSGSREWQSCESLARSVWQDVRPRVGDLVVYVPAGGAAVDALASVIARYGWDLKHAEVAAVLGEWERVGFVARAPAEDDLGGELLRICAIPPTVTAEQERLRRGPQGGLTRAEIQAAYRARKAAEKGGEEGPVTGNGDRAEKGNKPRHTGAPAAPLSPSSGPPKGGPERGVGAAPVAERVEVPDEARRTAEELAALPPATRGALLLARIGKGVPVELLNPKADPIQVRELGDAVAELGCSEVELLGVAAWLRTVPDDARKALTWSKGIRSGGAITVGFLLCTARDRTRWAGLRAVLEVGVPWARKMAPGSFAPPVKAGGSAGELGAVRDTAVAR